MQKIAIAAATAALLPATALFAGELSMGDAVITYDFTGFNGTGFESGPGESAVTSSGRINSNEIIVRGLSASPTDVFTGPGSSGNNGILDYGETATGGSGAASTDYGRGTSTGGVTDGGVYAFAVGVNTLLGIQPATDDFTPGFFAFRITNTDSDAITSLTLASSLFVNNNGDQSNSFQALLSDDLMVDGSDGVFDSFVSTAAADLAPTFLAADDTPLTPGLSGTLSGLNIVQNQTVYLLFASNRVDLVGSGEDDEFGLGSVTVAAQYGAAPIPEPLSAGAAGLLGLVALRRRR